MRTILKVGIVVVVLFAIALGIYALARSSATQDKLVYSNVKITRIEFHDWRDDIVFLDNGGTIGVRNAVGLMIGHNYDIYQSWTGHYTFKLLG